MIGLDTSAIIDIFKGNAEVKIFLDSNSEPLAATIMSYLELFFGIDDEKKAHREEADYYRDFFAEVYNFGLTKESCEKAAVVYQSLKKKGKPIETFDCAIAAILLTNGITKILTRNAKHFENISQLTTISY